MGVGPLVYQINDADQNPVVGEVIMDAENDVWYKMSGEWTGSFSNDDASLYVNTWDEKGGSTAYEVRNFVVDVTEIKLNTK
jgi:hypothetical protein